MTNEGTARASGLRRRLARLFLGEDVPARLESQAVQIEALHRNVEALTAGMAPIFDWMKGAEAHLAGLQGGFDRLRGLHDIRTDQIDDVTAGLAELRDRIGELETINSEMALAWTKLRISVGQPQ